MIMNVAALPLDCYLDVVVRQGTGLYPNVILGRALDHLRASDIGIFATAFPFSQTAADRAAGLAGDLTRQARPTLGDCLQVFGPRDVVVRARAGMEDLGTYVSAGPIIAIRPQGIRFANYRRVRDDRTPAQAERELRRTLKRVQDGRRPPLTEDEIMSRRSSRVATDDWPHVTVTSHSTGRCLSPRFRRTITDDFVSGEFDMFGFARHDATVPHLPPNR
jgi:CRISPR-associated endoribonuclease Cas6/Csy4 subtype I-F